MENTGNKAAKELLRQEEKQCDTVRRSIAERMKEMECSAVLWSENIFGSTSYPLISDFNGHTYNVHGLRRNSQGGVCAVTDYPTKEYITGVKTCTEQEATELIKPSMLVCSGTPEEWDILADCFDTVVQVLKARKDKNSPALWW